jgi:hypothetical protein
MSYDRRSPGIGDALVRLREEIAQQAEEECQRQREALARSRIPRPLMDLGEDHGDDNIVALGAGSAKTYDASSTPNTLRPPPTRVGPWRWKCGDRCQV